MFGNGEADLSVLSKTGDCRRIDEALDEDAAATAAAAAAIAEDAAAEAL